MNGDRRLRPSLTSSSWMRKPYTRLDRVIPSTFPRHTIIHVCPSRKHRRRDRRPGMLEVWLLIEWCRVAGWVICDPRLRGWRWRCRCPERSLPLSPPRTHFKCSVGDLVFLFDNVESPTQLFTEPIPPCRRCRRRCTAHFGAARRSCKDPPLHFGSLGIRVRPLQRKS